MNVNQMNVKALVGTALVLSAFIIGNIVLLGVASGTGALLLHFAFTAALFAVALVAIRRLLSPRSLVMGSVLVVLIALATVQLASGLHAYERALSGTPSSAASLESQISSIQAKNAYYANTISYLSGAINTSQAHVKSLRQRIDTAIVQEYGQQYAQPAPQAVQQTNTTSREREERHERGEFDD